MNKRDDDLPSRCVGINSEHEDTKDAAAEKKLEVRSQKLEEKGSAAPQGSPNSYLLTPNSSSSAALQGPSNSQLLTPNSSSSAAPLRVIFCAARLQKEKDIPTLIKAFALLQQQKLEVRSQKLEEKGSEALQGSSNSYLLTPNSSSIAAALLIAGEGDQRPEIEKLIESMFKEPKETGTKKTEDDDSPRRHEDTKDAAKDKKLEVRSQKIEEGRSAGQPAGHEINNDSSKTLSDAPHRVSLSEATPNVSLSEAQPSVSLKPPQAAVSLSEAPLQSPPNSYLLTPNSSSSGALQSPPNSYLLTPNSSHREAVRRNAVALLGFRRDVAALMAACDIFVLPAPAEPFGLVLLEAMAMGKPVIAANAGGPCEIVVHGQTGLLFEPGNPQSLAAAMADLLNNPEKAKAMGAAGRKRFEDHFTAARMAAQIAAIYAAAQ